MTAPRKAVRIRPFEGESASSLLCRASVLLSPAPATIVSALLGRQSYLASAVHSGQSISALADFLGISEVEVAKTMAHRGGDGIFAIRGRLDETGPHRVDEVGALDPVERATDSPQVEHVADEDFSAEGLQLFRALIVLANEGADRKALRQKLS